MKQIIVGVLLALSINMWAGAHSRNSLLDSIGMKFVLLVQMNDSTFNMEHLNAYKMDSIINETIDRSIEKMKQNSKEDSITITKNVLISILIAIIGVLILIVGVIYVCLHKLYKRLWNMEDKYDQDARKHNKYYSLVDELINKINRLIKRVEISDKEEVVSDELAFTRSVSQEKNGVEEKMEEKESKEREKDKQTEKSQIDEYVQEEGKIEIEFPLDKPNEPQQEKLKLIYYAKPLMDGSLKTTEEPEDYYFIISIDKGSSVGRYTVYENAKQMTKAIKNKKAVLDNFCEAIGSSMDAIAIQNINGEEGEAEEVRSGIWKVNRKAKIKYIKG